MKLTDVIQQLESLAVLDEPIRRKLYLYVAGQGRDVSRNEAARAVRVSRALAAFHLDKLVKAGLLETTFRRLSDRVGPGAGRPSKLYRRGSALFDVTLPQRRYELAARVLVQAMTTRGGGNAEDALRTAARDWGTRLAQDPSLSSRHRVPLSRAVHALKVCGFEPCRAQGGEVLLRNCPFDSLRADGRELICRMNLALVKGLLAGLELDDVQATLAPREGMCCVALRNGGDGDK